MTISPPMGTTGQQAYPPAPADPAFQGQFMPPMGPPPAPSLPPAPQPPRRRRMWPVFGAFVAVTLGAVAATAAITYNIAHNDGTAPSKAAPIEKTAPEYTTAQVTAAKQRVCGIFDKSVRGQQGTGGLRMNGDLNIPVMIRTMNGVSAVQNALTPAAPPEVADAAKQFITSTLDLTTAAAANAPAEQGNRLNDLANTAIDQFADACGLAH